MDFLWYKLFKDFVTINSMIRSRSRNNKIKSYKKYIIEKSQFVYYPKKLNFINRDVNNDFLSTSYFTNRISFQIPLEKKGFKLTKIVEVFLSNDKYTRRKHKRILHRWFNVCISVYNYTLDFLLNLNNNSIKIPSFFDLREMMNNTLETFRINSKPYIKMERNTRIQRHVLDESVKEARTNFIETKKRIDKINFKREPDEPLRPIVLKKKSINDKSKILHLELQAQQSDSFRNLISQAFLDGENFDLNTIKNTCIFQKKGSRYYLYVPYDVKRKTFYNKGEYKVIYMDKIVTVVEKNGQKYLVSSKYIKGNFISLDPGIRKILMGYSNIGVFKFGEKTVNKLKRYAKREWKLKKVVKEEKKNYNKDKNKKLRKLKNKVKTCKRKQKNVVTDFHNKTALHLARSYENVLMGDINTKSLCGPRSNLSTFNKSILKKLRFYELKNKLKNKCNEYGSGIKLINEDMTSKLCSKCGNEKNDLGSNETYNCSKCHLEIDRDLNGCINILIRYLGIKKS